MPHCFAYGSNMDVAAMAARCPSSKLVGVARLARHRFFIMDNGYASVARDPSRDVHGLLWDIALADMRPLDAYESVATGLYAKIPQTVILPSGGARRALVYVGGSTAPGRPRPGYMEGVLDAARKAGLPEAYLRDLARLVPAGVRSPAPEPAEPAKGPVTGVRPRFADPFGPRD